MKETGGELMIKLQLKTQSPKLKAQNFRGRFLFKRTFSVLGFAFCILRFELPLSAAITLPIEVMGPEGTVAPPVTVNVPSGQSAGVTGLWLQIHNLSYEYKGSIQVNNSPWIALATP